jgi:UDP-galactopyranose mutase
MFDGASLIARCINDCRRVGIIGDLVPIWAAFTSDLPYAYVIHDHERDERVRVIRDWLALHDIVLAGRYSEWSHHDAAHSFLSGRAAADRAHASVAAHEHRVA